MALVKFTRRAAFDLDEIEQYSIKKWGQKTAEKYMDETNLATKRLEERPAFLKEMPEVSGRLKFYRQKKVRH